MDSANILKLLKSNILGFLWQIHVVVKTTPQHRAKWQTKMADSVRLEHTEKRPVGGGVNTGRLHKGQSSLILKCII